MIKQLFLAAVAIIGFTATVAAQDMARVKMAIDTLTAPGMHGRGYVSYGDRYAAAFIKQQFEKAGLQNFNDTYFQFFTLTVNTFPDRVALQAGNTLLNTGADFITLPGSGGGSGRANVIQLDSLSLATQSGLEKFRRARLKRKALVLTSPEVRKMVQQTPTLVGKLTEAAAVITLQPKKLTASLSPVQAPNPQFEVLQSAWPAGTKKVRYAVDAELLRNHISQNVIGYLPGRTNPDSVIIICAHYDHLGRMGRDTYFPGANDNASGTSMLIELAHHYAQPANQPAYSMLFIAFSAEEAGLIGSEFYTKHPLIPLAQTKFLINLDLMGTGDDGMMVVNGKTFEKEFALLERLNKQHNYLPALKKRGEAANSDHYHFTRQGVRGFFFYTLGGTTAYHDVHDTAAQLPLTRYREVFSLITAFIAAL